MFSSNTIERNQRPAKELLKEYFDLHARNPNYSSNREARWYTELSNGQHAGLS